MRVNSRESPILKGAQQLMAVRGFPCWRMNSGRLRNPKGRPVAFGFPGCPDLWGLVPGTAARLIVLECKAPGSEPTKSQWIFLEAIRAAGGVPLVVSDLGVLDRALGHLLSRPYDRLDYSGQLLEVIGK